MIGQISRTKPKPRSYLNPRNWRPSCGFKYQLTPEQIAEMDREDELEARAAAGLGPEPDTDELPAEKAAKKKVTAMRKLMRRVLPRKLRKR